MLLGSLRDIVHFNLLITPLIKENSAGVNSAGVNSAGVNSAEKGASSVIVGVGLFLIMM